MKKKALFKDTFREIKKSLGRFLSIMLIIAVGVGFFVGVKATAPSMYGTAEDYFSAQNLMDVEILSTVGFSREDADAVAELDEIKHVTLTYSADLITENNGEYVVAKVMAIPADMENSINLPVLREGRMPTGEDECVVIKSTLLGVPYAIGDEITFEEYAGETVTDDVLSRRSFKVVGIIESPLYISYSFGTSSIGSGSISSYIMIPAENFLYERYTEMYVTLKCHDEGISAFDEEYDEILSQLTKKLEKLGIRQYNLFADETNAQIADAEEEYNEGKEKADKELSEARTQLEDARKQIDDGLLALEQGWKDYEAGSEEADKQIADAERQLRHAEASIQSGKKELAAGIAEYEQKKKETEAKLKDARAQLDSGWAEYNAGKSEYEKAEREFSAATAEYQDAIEEYEQAKEEYEQAQRAVSMAQATLDQIKAQIDQEESHTISATDLAILQAALEASKAQLQNYQEQLSTMEPGTPEYIEMEQKIADLEESIARQEEELANLSVGSEVSKEEMLEAYDEAQAALDDAQRELDEAKAQMDEADAQMAEYNEYKAQLESAESELNSARIELEAGEREYEAGKVEAERQLAAAAQEIEDGKRELENAKASLKSGQRTLKKKKAEAQKELDDAHRQLVDSEEQLDDAQDEYEEGMAEYTDSMAEVEKELSSGFNRIQNAKSMISDVVAGKWYVLSREDIMVNYANFRQDAMRIDAIGDVFPVFFLMVAALVCLTTMTRMIDEQRTQMGTYKALGYTQFETASKYLVYAALACVGGCIVGPVALSQILPRVIFGAYSILYSLPYFIIKVPIGMLLVSVVVALICTVAVAAVVCWKELRTTTAALMRPKAPKAGKKIFLEKLPWLWKHFSFFQKLTARNLLRYKLRLFMTVLGIAGCMALVVAGFGLNNAISPISDIQYGELSREDVTFYLNQTSEKEKLDDLITQLEEDPRVESQICVVTYDCKASDPEGKVQMEDTFVFVPENKDSIAEIINLRDPDTKTPVALTDDGAVITNKLSKKLGVGIGDEICTTFNDKTYTMKVTGIAECYIYNYVYISPDYYEKVTGEKNGYSQVILCCTDDMGSHDAFSEEWLAKDSRIVSAYFTDMASNAVKDTMASLSIVVFVMILCAGVLAFIVVYNLTNINISERVREIATVKVLGFNHKEVNMYIFRENIIMSVLGVLVGSFLGYLMAQFIIQTVEVSMVTFSHDIKFVSYLYSACITMGFTVLVNLFMTKRMKAISMVESLKAIE